MEQATIDSLKGDLEQLMILTVLSFNSVEAFHEGTLVRFNIKTDEPGMIIGKHGETLFALQQVFRTMVKHGKDIEENIIVDVDDYRLNQEENACQMAQDIARKVRSVGEPVELIPMPSYKRRAIHMMFTEGDFGDLEVYSVGEGEMRRIRVEKKK
jgi:spoIIIJ-associated protein